VTAVLVAAWGVWTMLRAVLDLASRQEVEGQVVRRRTYSRGNKSDHYLGVDSGRSDKVKAWLVPAGVYDRLREGSFVKATIGPRLGHVFQVDLVSGSRATAAPLPAMVEAEMPAVPGSDPGVGTAAIWTAGLDGTLASSGIEVDPAKMVTAEDAGLALGTPVGRARTLFEQPLPVGRMRGCEYRRLQAGVRCRCSPPPGTWSGCWSA
jgi:hypothetical protein